MTAIRRTSADFIGCVAFGGSAEFAEKYLRQGTKIVITGRIQTGSYTNRDGQKVYTTDVVVEDQEFAESKSASSEGGSMMRQAPVTELHAAPDAVTGECIVRRWIHEHPGRNRRRASVQLDLNLITVTV